MAAPRKASTGGNAMLRLIGVALIALPIGSSIALAEDLKLPPLKRQSTPQAVIDEHMDALNKCDWNRIMAQYPPDYQLNLPDGVVVKGREEAGKLFANFVKPVDQGGLCGMKFTPEQTFVVGETLNVQWKAESEFLAEPYKGSDAYETHDGLIAAMVSTFKGADLKVKK
jgi:SnoaL-like domain